MEPGKFTFDALGENEIQSIHEKQPRPINKLTPMEQFYTHVSMVYDNQLMHHCVPKINDQDDDDDDDDDVDDDDDAMQSEPDSGDDEDDAPPDKSLSKMVENLDKARYQLDELCTIIDMMTNRGSNNELLYKLSRPLAYPDMNRRHWCGLAQQKHDQFADTRSIFEDGIRSAQSAIDRGRRFSKNLRFLSQYWRLTTLNVLKNDSELNITGSGRLQKDCVFIDYRLQRKKNSLDGLLPLSASASTGNIQIHVQHRGELVRYLKHIPSPQQKRTEQILGFEDDDDDADVDGDEDGKDKDDKDEDEDWDESCLYDDWRICEFVYHSAINLLYLELFSVLRTETLQWSATHLHGISCKLQSDGVRVHCPSMADFVIKFCAQFVDAVAAADCSPHSFLKWNKMMIEGDESNVDAKLSAEIESSAIRMLFAQWKRKCDDALFARNTWTDFKRSQQCQYQHRIQNAGESKAESIGKPNVAAAVSETPLNILHMIISKVCHLRLSNKLKTFLQTTISTKYPFLSIQWLVLKHANTVNVLIGHKQALLLKITLRNMSMIVTQHASVQRAKRLDECVNLEQIESVLFLLDQSCHLIMLSASLRSTKRCAGHIQCNRLYYKSLCFESTDASVGISNNKLFGFEDFGRGLSKNVGEDVLERADFGWYHNFLPIETLQDTISNINFMFDVPFWSIVVAIPFVTKTFLTFPIHIYQQRKYEKRLPSLPMGVYEHTRCVYESAAIKKASGGRDTFELMTDFKSRKQQMYEKYGYNSSTSQLLPYTAFFVQLPIHWTCFIALRTMNSKTALWNTGGFTLSDSFDYANLAVSDSTMILPASIAASIALIQFTLYRKNQKRNAGVSTKKLFAMNTSAAALFIYWSCSWCLGFNLYVLSNLLSYAAQIKLLDSDVFRKTVGLRAWPQLTPDVRKLQIVYRCQSNFYTVQRTQGVINSKQVWIDYLSDINNFSSLKAVTQSDLDVVIADISALEGDEEVFMSSVRSGSGDGDGEDMSLRSDDEGEEEQRGGQYPLQFMDREEVQQRRQQFKAFNHEQSTRAFLMEQRKGYGDDDDEEHGQPFDDGDGKDIEASEEGYHQQVVIQNVDRNKDNKR